MGNEQSKTSADEVDVAQRVRDNIERARKEEYQKRMMHLADKKAAKARETSRPADAMSIGSTSSEEIPLRSARPSVSRTATEQKGTADSLVSSPEIAMRSSEAPQTREPFGAMGLQDTDMPSPPRDLLEEWKPRKERLEKKRRVVDSSSERSSSENPPHLGFGNEIASQDTGMATSQEEGEIREKPIQNKASGSFGQGRGTKSISKASAATAGRPTELKELPLGHRKKSSISQVPKFQGDITNSEQPLKMPERPVANKSRQPTITDINVRPTKRSAGSTSSDHERKQSLPKILKRASAASHATSTVSKSALATDGTVARVPPTWYQETQASQRRTQDLAGADIALQRLREQIAKCKKLAAGPNGAALSKDINRVREILHTTFFIEVDEVLVRSRRMLHNEGGLPQLFDTKFSGGVDWPWDIRADAEELYNKWCARIFEIDLLRGIIPGKPGKKDGSTDGTSAKLLPGFKRLMEARTHGNGALLNGQWWPAQLCALRDGAHGVSQGGICASSKEGVYSVIMSGGHDYPDIDDGEEVLYCGTDSTDGTPSKDTQRMLDSVKGKPVRLIRSSKLQSLYRPEIGFRYDGLYDVVNSERLDGRESLRQRHRFKLVRVPGQDPIRGGNGPEKRPTQQEIDAYNKDKRLRGFM